MSRDDWASLAYQKILETGADWADTKTAFNTLDRARHSVLAEIKSSFTELQSDAARETAARASKQYKDFLEELRKAEYKYNHASVRYTAAKELGSYRQTQESLKKAEINAQAHMP